MSSEDVLVGEGSGDIDLCARLGVDDEITVALKTEESTDGNIDGRTDVDETSRLERSEGSRRCGRDKTRRVRVSRNDLKDYSNNHIKKNE